MTAARTLHAQLHLLDRQLVRADDDSLAGKVDDLALAFDDRGRPYVAAVLTGPLALGPRIGGVVGRLMVSVTELFRPEEDPAPQRIPMELVSDIGSAIRVGGYLQEAALERWARAHLIAPLPGSGATSGGPDHRPSRRSQPVDELRLGPLIGRPVADATGAVVGQVADVQLSQDGPMLGQVQHALRVSGLIVVPRNTGQLLGYERGPGGQSPWLVRVVIRRLHRHSRYVRWEQIESLEPHVRLAVPAADLAPLSSLYQPQPHT
ncbi:hypothetical protein ACWDLG_34225 [Nonomuraea sp. NPDC003727]